MFDAKLLAKQLYQKGSKTFIFPFTLLLFVHSHRRLILRKKRMNSFNYYNRLVLSYLTKQLHQSSTVNIYCH